MPKRAPNICASNFFATRRMQPPVARDRIASISIRALCVAVLLLVVSATAVLAETPLFHAGIARITIAAKVPLDALIWYPT
jgi:hypothetical protein